ncbi:MAG: SdrD B-like domain-containing protein, partial [Saprospiraceae bacterium]
DPDNNTLNDDNGTGSGTGEVKSLPITLTSGGEPTNDGDGNNGNLTVDFGFAGTGSIGDFVWKDLNANGIQNGGGETGVPGVIVTLTYTINSTSFTIKDTTDANGLYLFPNLPPSSTYTLSFSNVPAGMVISPSNVGDDNFDSDGPGAIAITLAAGQNDLSNDLGLYAPAAIGNFVWHDLNANGIQDPGEPGISGVSVSLSGGPSTPPATNTDGNGKYLFSNLTPGTYTVTFGTPAGGYLASPANVGSTTDDKDSDAGSGGTTSAYTLVSGQTDTTVDAGYYKLASLGDYVWYDKNKNGIQDNIIDPNGNIVGPEMPVQGISVQLKRVSDNSVAGTAVTNSSGFYLFSNVIPGDYYVQMVTATIPANFDITQKDVSGNTMDSKDSDFNPATGKSDNTNLTSGENDLTWDMCIYMISASIVDPCICKNNATNGKNGQFDEILDVMATPGGSWMIIQQTGMYLSTSPAPPAAPIPVPVGTMLNNVGLGMYRYNFVHIDSLGYTVRVTNGTDTLMITNLCPYPDVIMAAFDTALCIYDAPINLMATANMPGTIDYIITTSGNTEIHTNVIDPATLGMGTFTLKLTFTPLDPTLCQNTYIQSFNISINNCPAALGNFVWNDQNANGKQDPGEPGIPNVNVTLTNVTTAATTNAMTAPNGKYLFNNLAPGTYKVTFGTPAGYIPTTANAAGVLDDVDSDAGAGGMTGNYTLIGGQVDSTVDAGFNCNMTIPFTPQFVCGTQKINLRSFEPVGYEGGTWKNGGIPVTNPNSVGVGMYTYTDTSAQGCISAGTLTVTKVQPDYTPILRINPTITRGSSNLRLTFDIFELLNISACSDVYVTIPREGERYNFTYNPSATSIGTESVTNSHWQYIASNPTFHVWKWIGDPSNGVPSLFPALHEDKFGVEGIYNPQGTDGVTTFTVQIFQGSGGEINFTNNTSSRTLTYFSH